MAGKTTGRKNTGSKKSTGSKKQTSGSKARGKQVQEEETSFLPSEVFIIGAFAIAVILFLSNFHLCGKLGDVLRSVQLGLFGMIGFTAPILLFAGTCFAMANRGSMLACVKMAAVIVGVWFLCGFAEMIFGAGYVEDQTIGEIYARCAGSGLGGGVLGGFLIMGIGSVLGIIGAYLVLLVGLVICAVCITEKSVVSVVKKGGGKAYQYAKEDVDKRRIIHEEKKEERRRLREEQKVRGVNLNSTKLDAQETFEEEEDGQYACEAEAYDNGMDPEYAQGQAYEDDYGYNGRDYAEPQTYEDLRYYEDSRYYADSRDYDPATGYSNDDEKQTGRYDQEFDPEVGNQVFMDDLLPTSYKNQGGRAWNKADVFTGNITRPPVYIDTEDDTVPFDPEEVTTENVPDSTVPPLYFVNRRTNQGIDHQIDEDMKGSLNNGSTGADAESAYNAGFVNGGMGNDADQANDMNQFSGTAPFDGSDPYADEPSYKEMSHVPYIPVDQTLDQETDDSWMQKPQGSNEDDAFDAYDDYDFSADRRMPGEPGVIDGALTMDEGTKKVVTATGKVIESDTEALQKKLESRRQEAREEKTGGVDAVVKQQPVIKKEYVFPPMNLLKRGNGGTGSDKEYRETAIKLQQTLRDFGVGVTVTNVSCGPTVTRYELHPEQGVKVSKIVGLTDDIKLSLAAADIRIEAPIPGKSAVGIEVPNKENTVVYLRELLESEEFKGSSSKLSFAVGKDIGGQVIVTDIAKMPHLLIAGSTGSGKSVCINTLIMSILYKAHPDDVKLIMVDPKVVELSAYNGIPHLLIPVVTDPKKASGALNWAVAEMDDRYNKFAKYNVRNLQGYNAKVEELADIEDENKPQKMPQIVIIIDELADLMMVAPGEVEGSICRLAQLARAAGIHLVIATQRPSVNVITGLIKANVPSRIAFAVSSGVDSRTILDMYGAEKLLGKGDMLFFPSGIPKPQRVQGAFVSDSEVSKVVEFLAQQQDSEPEYNTEIENQISMPAMDAQENNHSDRDEYFVQAAKFIIDKDKGSIGMLQRMFKIGFNRAARIMDQLAQAGVVGEEEGTKPRKVLMTQEEFDAMMRGE